MDWAGALRADLAIRATQYAGTAGLPFFQSLGAKPTTMFAHEGEVHGNFHPLSFGAICGSRSWAARLDKSHARAEALPEDRRATAKELDSCNSSDALVMNSFCFPGAAKQIVSVLLPDPPDGTPEFGVRARVPLRDGSQDLTEVDMRIGDVLFEAKLTERDFTDCPKARLEGYRDFGDVFESGQLPQDEHTYHGYQLIRNVLAAHATDGRFFLLCDGRRPDLLHWWWAVHSAIRTNETRGRCGFLLWQEIAAAAPAELGSFLVEKYGL